MKKSFKGKKFAPQAQVDPNIAALIEKMQQQLFTLEKKIDILVSQSSQKPFGVKDQAKPIQRFDNSFRQDRGSRENSFRERSYFKAICADCNTECEVPFKPTGDRPVYCKECFAKRKQGGGSPFKAKFEHSPKEETPVQERHFDKPQSMENRRPGGGRKKQSSRKRR